MRGVNSETSSLATGTVAAILASACCAGPLLLVSLGLGGAWLSNLAALEPYRWLFVGAGAAALAFAWPKIFRPAAACAPGEVCAAPQVNRAYRFAFWTVAALVVIAAVFPYVALYMLGG